MVVAGRIRRERKETFSYSLESIVTVATLFLEVQSGLTVEEGEQSGVLYRLGDRKIEGKRWMTWFRWVSNPSLAWIGTGGFCSARVSRREICTLSSYRRGCWRLMTFSRRMMSMRATESTPSTPSGVQEKSTCLDVVGHKVTAVSVGGWETCIQLPVYRLAIDIGRCPPSAINMDTVAFTHMHMDHIGGIGMHIATRSMRKMTPPVYIVPQEVLPDFQNLISAFEKLDGSTWNYDLKQLPRETTHSLGKGRFLRSYKTYHTVPSQGYLVYSSRKKLRNELTHLSSGEIAQLRRTGTAVAEEVLVPEIAVPGDTTIEVLEKEADVRTARVLVIEITFVDNVVSVEDARRFGHIHIDEVVEKAHLFQNEAVIFTHFSARYPAEEIQRKLEERLPKELYDRSHALVANHRSQVEEAKRQTPT